MSLALYEKIKKIDDEINFLTSYELEELWEAMK